MTGFTFPTILDPSISNGQRGLSSLATINQTSLQRSVQHKSHQVGRAHNRRCPNHSSSLVCRQRAWNEMLYAIFRTAWMIRSSELGIHSYRADVGKKIMQNHIFQTCSTAETSLVYWRTCIAVCKSLVNKDVVLNRLTTEWPSLDQCSICRGWGFNPLPRWCLSTPKLYWPPKK